MPPRIKTARTSVRATQPSLALREGEKDGESVDVGIDNDIYYDGGLTTPLSPPPQTHQTKTGPSPSGSGSGSGSGRSSAASSRYTPRTPTPLSPVFLFASPTASPSLMSSASPPLASSSSPSTTVYFPGPHAVMPITGAAAVPTPPTLPTTVTAARPTLNRSLTQKYIPKHIAHYTPANPSKYILPTTTTTASPVAVTPTPSSRFREARETLWPRAFQLSPVRRQQVQPPLPSKVLPMPLNSPTSLVSPTSLSPISPILPPPIPAEKPQASNSFRKTILEHLEGWWDLGLLRGGTVKGRRALPRIQTTAMSPFSSRTGRAAEMDLSGHSPVAFV